MPRECTVQLLKCSSSAITCEQARRYVGKHASGQSCRNAAWLLAVQSAMLTGRQAVWLVVKPVGLRLILRAGRREGRQPQRSPTAARDHYTVFRSQNRCGQIAKMASAITISGK